MKKFILIFVDDRTVEFTPTFETFKEAEEEAWQIFKSIAPVKYLNEVDLNLDLKERKVYFLSEDEGLRIDIDRDIDFMDIQSSEHIYFEILVEKV